MGAAAPIPAVPVKTILLAAACVLALCGFAYAPPPSSAPNLVRAQAAYGALGTYFGGGQASYDAYPARGPASAWSSSQALAAVLSLQEIPRSRLHVAGAVRSAIAALDAYWTPQGYVPYPVLHGGGPVYIDDNEWLGQDLVRAYDDLHDPAYLARAEQILGVVTAAWDGNASDACSGGVWWTRDPANHDRNTVSTANGALLALALYRETRDRSDLQWAQRMVGWVDRCLRAPDGLYRDRIGLDGTVDAREWSYNQGAMLAAYAGLSRATGDAAALSRAQEIARLSLARFGSRFAGEPPEFVAIFFRDLRELNAAAPDAAYGAAAQIYADAQWASVRNGRTGLFGSTLLAQAAAVDLYAQLSA